ncbi:MAG: multicomponent Na+:H+ antiporter subunit D [Oceanospirillaceae bacterium]|jgi:multicomponent Na+:H+ antiporter subunit D
MISQLPVLQVILPLMAAPLCLMLRRSQLVWCFCLLVSFLSLLISLLLVQQVIAVGAISYEFGGWEVPWGIEYRIDHLNVLLLLIITFISSLVLIAARASIEDEIDQEKHCYFYILYLLNLSGMLGIVATGDAFNIFVFLEISSLSAYALIAMGSNKRALWASYQYLIMGTIGATFILIGIGMMYHITGTLNITDLYTRLAEVSQKRTLLTAFVFIIVGVCLKLALFPLHLWLPNAYAYAPSIVSAFLAATATKVAIYLLIRFTYSVFGPAVAFAAIPLQTLFTILGLLGIFVASIAAIYQSNVKLLFAYSSIAHIGYMIVGFSLNTVSGLTATLLHLFNHALMKSAIFLALAAIVFRIGNVELKNFQGLGRKMPWTMAAIVIAGLSLIGVPLTVGFVSKWYLLLAIIEQDRWFVAGLILLGSLLAVIYVWRIVEIAYFKTAVLTDKSDLNQVANQEAPWSFLVPIWVLIGANIYFGIDTRLSLYLAQSAAQSLFAVAP